MNETFDDDSTLSKKKKKIWQVFVIAHDLRKTVNVFWLSVFVQQP